MSRNETEGETKSYHSARAQPEWIIMASPSDLAALGHLPRPKSRGRRRMVSPSDLAALGHLPHSVREGKNVNQLPSKY
ncbi:MAG: hypothetical protein ABFR53_07895 [Actinomycetota bacterium]